MTKSRKEYYHEYKEKVLQYQKEYNELNKDKIKEYIKNYQLNNKELIKERRRQQYQKNKETKQQYYQNSKESIKEYRENNLDKINQREKDYREKNKDSVKEYQKNYKTLNKEQNNKRAKERREIDPLYKLSCNIRSIVYYSINHKDYKKESKTHEIIGCSYEKLKQHLESQFEDWMNWENYGNPKDGIFELNKTWDVDHIIPISSYSSEEELLKINHYTNLRPLCSYHNRWIKSNKIILQ